MEILERNIVVLFDEEITQKFVDFSNQLNTVIPSDIVLNRENMLPHVTLYTTNYPAKNEEKVLTTLEKATQSLKPFSLHFNKSVVDMLGVWINAEKTADLQNVHETTVDSLNEFRDGLYDEKELIAIGDNKERQESLVKYGMWAAKNLYIPHVTLSRPKDSKKLDEAFHLLPKTVDFVAEITEIAYVERGPFGTCKKVLQKFSLS